MVYEETSCVLINKMALKILCIFEIQKMPQVFCEGIEYTVGTVLKPLRLWRVSINRACMRVCVVLHIVGF